MQIYKKKELHVDNEGCVMNLRYMDIGYVHFLKKKGSKINVEKGETAFNEHEKFLLSRYVCWIFIL